jgi:hypothetical protein
VIASKIAKRKQRKQRKRRRAEIGRITKGDRKRDDSQATMRLWIFDPKHNMKKHDACREVPMRFFKARCRVWGNLADLIGTAIF